MIETLSPHSLNYCKIILFDGRCKLCNASCNFIIKHDKDKKFKFISMQSKKGQNILLQLKQPTKHFDTIILYDNSRLYFKSTAFLKILRQLPYPIKLLSILSIFPTFLLNFIYNYIARNRYKYFGKYDQCSLPLSEHKDRYL